MKSNHSLFLADKILSAKASFWALLEQPLAQRRALEKLAEVRSHRFPVDHAAFAPVYEGLASSYLGYAADDLHTCEQMAAHAEHILTANCAKSRNHDFRVGRMIHLRCQVRQRLNDPFTALSLGEEAMAIYNRTNLMSFDRSALMYTLIHLHKQVGSDERAARLTVEVQILNQALASRSARRPF